MGLVVKTLVVALLTLPVMAYVTGSMVGARSELPAQREPVVIGDRMDVEPPRTIESEPARRPGQDDDGPDDRDDPDDPGDAADDVSVVRPQPREIDDDAGDRDDGPDDDSRDDDSGDDDD